MLKILSQNLGLRIVLLSVGLALLLALVVLGLVSQVFLHESKQRFWSEQRTTTVSIAHLIDDSLVRRREALTELSRFLHNGQELRQVSEIQRLLDKRILLHRFFNGGLVLLDAKAEGVVDSPKLPDRVGTNYADRPHVQWVKKNLAPYVSHPFVGRKLQTPIFIINVPVLNQEGALLGYLIGISLLKDDFMITELAQRFIGTDEKVTIVDFKNNLFVSSTEPGYVFKPFGQKPLPNMLQKLKQGVKQDHTFGFDGQRVLYTAQKLTNIDWHVLTMNDLSEVEAPTYQMLEKAFWWVLGFLGLILPLFYLLMRKQLLPLKRAAERTEKAVKRPLSAKPLPIEARDEIGRLLDAFNHLTHRQNRQQALLSEAREQADQANNQKSLFLATMSHDIRTPMYGIMGLSDLGLRVQTQPEKMADCLYKIQHTGQGLLTLLDDILDLSKIEAGELNIQSLPFVFEDLVRSLESQFAPLIQAKNLDFMVRTDPELQAVYRGDSQRLGQVLTNLIGNAVKFTESGFVRLNVYQVRQTNDQAWLLFEVEDSGIGMTKSQRTRLFQSFRQGDDSISQTFGGSGLGLKICQDLVGLMDGGAIAVQSHPGIGSIFYFELPMTLCTPQEICKVQNKARHQAQQKARYELSDFALTGKVLVVEDNVLNQEITVELLERAGLQTCLAESGHQAVSMAFEQKFDLILMDKQMPDLDGYQAARKIREFDDSTPIIALTAAAMHDEREHALAAGLNDYLSKPLDFDRLLSTLANWLGEHKAYLPKVDESSELDGTYKSRKNATLYWVDVSTGLRLVGGNKAFYQKMLKAYHQQIEKDFERILKRWDLAEFEDNQAWSEIERAIHSLKGISINLGVDQVVRILESMEVLVIEKQSPDSALSDEWWSTINVTQEKIEEVIAHFEVDNS